MHHPFVDEPILNATRLQRRGGSVFLCRFRGGFAPWVHLNAFSQK